MCTVKFEKQHARARLYLFRKLLGKVEGMVSPLWLKIFSGPRVYPLACSRGTCYCSVSALMRLHLLRKMS